MKYIIWIFVLIVVAGGSFYIWQNRQKYFFKGEAPYQVYEENENSDKNENNDIWEEKMENNKDEDSTSAEGVINEENSNSNDQLVDILENHCKNKCENKKESSDYKQCLEICGFEISEENQETDCEKIDDIFQKDVCHKNQAIKEKNAGICDKISDELLRLNCKDRVVEELF